MQPDHDTINQFRQDHLEPLKGLFVEGLLMAHFMGYVTLGNISIDGRRRPVSQCSKIHADASKSKAVSYGRIGQMEEHLPIVQDLTNVTTAGGVGVLREAPTLQAGG